MTSKKRKIKKNIQQVYYDHFSINSQFAQTQDQFQNKFEAMDTKFMGEFDTLKSTLNQLLNQSTNPSFSKQLSHLDCFGSSYSMAFQSNSFHRDPHLPRVEVNKFDGSNPRGWATQMEHYFSLHGVTNELAKINYVVLYLDLEH